MKETNKSESTFFSLVYSLKYIKFHLQNKIFDLSLCLVIKVWDIRTRKLKQDLPGHADEVLYTYQKLK